MSFSFLQKFISCTFLRCISDGYTVMKNYMTYLKQKRYSLKPNFDKEVLSKGDTNNEKKSKAIDVKIFHSCSSCYFAIFKGTYY